MAPAVCIAATTRSMPRYARASSTATTRNGEASSLRRIGQWMLMACSAARSRVSYRATKGTEA
jgi:hypothetical protein